MSETQVSNRYCVRADEVAGYHPANHTGTLNRRLIGPETVGATQLEVVLGVVEKGRGAEPHAHPGIEGVLPIGRPRARRSGGRNDGTWARRLLFLSRRGAACFRGDQRDAGQSAGDLCAALWRIAGQSD